MSTTIKSELKIYQRKSVRLQGVDYSEAGGFFITIASFATVAGLFPITGKAIVNI